MTDLGYGYLVQGGKGYVGLQDSTATLTFPTAATEEPRLLGTVENKLGIADWLKQEGHECAAL